VIAVACVDVAVGGGKIRRLSDEIDHAAGGAAAVKRALRAAKHFHPLEVVKRRFRQERSEEVNVVDVGGDAGFLIATDHRLADAADREIRTGEIALAVGDAGRAELQVLDLHDLVRGKVLRRIGGDGNGDGLNVLGAFLGGDHHLLDLRKGRRGKRTGKQSRVEKNEGPSGPERTIGHFRLPVFASARRIVLAAVHTPNARGESAASNDKSSLRGRARNKATQALRRVDWGGLYPESHNNACKRGRYQKKVSVPRKRER